MDEFDRSFYELMKKKYIIDRLAYDFHKRRLELEKSLYHHDFGDIGTNGLIHNIDKSHYQDFIETGTYRSAESIENLVNEAHYDVRNKNEDRSSFGPDGEISRSLYYYNGLRDENGLTANDSESTKGNLFSGINSINVTQYDIENVNENKGACVADDEINRSVYDNNELREENCSRHNEDVGSDQSVYNSEDSEQSRQGCDLSLSSFEGSDNERQADYYDHDEETINYSEGYVDSGTDKEGIWW